MVPEQLLEKRSADTFLSSDLEPVDEVGDGVERNEWLRLLSLQYSRENGAPVDEQWLVVLDDVLYRRSIHRSALLE